MTSQEHLVVVGALASAGFALFDEWLPSICILGVTIAVAVKYL